MLFGERVEEMGKEKMERLTDSVRRCGGGGWGEGRAMKAIL